MITLKEGTIEQVEILKNDVYAVEGKSMEHVQHDIVDKLRFYRQIVLSIVTGSTIALHILYAICFCITIVGGVITFIADFGEPFVVRHYTLELILLVVGLMIFVVEKLTFSATMKSVERTMKDIIESELKDYKYYDELSDEDKTKFCEAILIKKTSKEEA